MVKNKIKVYKNDIFSVTSNTSSTEKRSNTQNDYVDMASPEIEYPGNFVPSKNTSFSGDCNSSMEESSYLSMIPDLRNFTHGHSSSLGGDEDFPSYRDAISPSSSSGKNIKHFLLLSL